MNCWLYDILINQCDEKTAKFIEKHKKDVRFTSFNGYEVEFKVKNVGLHITYPRTIHRICNIRTGAA